MGAIKEGDDPEDYYIKHDKLLAVVSLGALAGVGIATAIALTQNRKSSRRKPKSKTVPSLPKKVPVLPIG